MRLNIFATHPVQYHVPLWRALSRHRDLEVKVFYFSDQGVRDSLDKDFGVAIKWDVDLLAGYAHEFLSRDAPLDDPRKARISDVNALLSRERPDWVLISGYTHAFERQLLRAARRHHAKVLMRGEFSDLSFGARSLPKRLLRAAYLRWFYAQVDRFCFIGEGARRHLVRNGVTDSQLFFSPYSVDDALIATQKRELSRARARSELGIDDRRFVFVLSGKLIPRKDPLAIVRAIERLPDREHVGLISLGDGELNDDFSAHARALLGDRFIAPGFVNQSQLGRYFIAADAMVMTSRFETWGLVVNEAMHYGIPVIANAQVGSTANLVLHGQTGLLYESENPASLADAMLELVRSPARARKLGAAAHELIANYTIEASAAGIFQALKLSAPGRPLARPASELLP